MQREKPSVVDHCSSFNVKSSSSLDTASTSTVASTLSLSAATVFRPKSVFFCGFSVEEAFFFSGS